ncbi:transmembrane protein 39A-like [Rhopilema esculentum]|uniref:transmembrane protein 39A-like n=1 Tax=Rhopilema esculentum TaxID=499914 RepID=UPI0031E0EC50|eukprot:gene17671-9324_t
MLLVYLLAYLPIRYFAQSVNNWKSKSWFMPVLRKFGAHKGAVRNIKLAERNGSIAASHGSAGATLASYLTIVPIYHKPVPMLPELTPMQFELALFGYLMVSMLMQFVNIYKTNAYVIDLHLALFIVIILSRRISWLAVKKTLASEVVHSSAYWAKIVLKTLFFALMIAAGIWSFCCVVQNSSIEDVLFLCYPFAVYLGTFGFTLNPYGHKVLLRLGSHQLQAVQDLIASNTSLLARPTPQSLGSELGSISPTKCEQKNKVEETVQNGQATNQNGNITNNGHLKREDSSRCVENHCTVSPDSVRYEAECLRTDFNLRIKQVIFSSVVSAYYVGFIPVKFTQNGSFYYDPHWAIQYVLFIWWNSFVLLIGHLMPFVYIDALHRCAVHLGSWKRYYGHRETQHVWSPLTIWPQGVIVKHYKVSYKAVGKQNTAVPGDGPQSRLYFLFGSPLRLINWLVLFQLTSAILQLYLLFQASYWHQIMSVVVMLYFTYAVLFRLLRERWAVQATLEEHEACAGT